MAIIILFITLMWVNNYVIERVYISGAKAEVTSFVSELIREKPKLEVLQNYIKSKNKEGKIVIAYAPYRGSDENFNADIRWQLSQNKMVVNKFWIVKDRILDVQAGNSAWMRFDQGKVNSTYLTYLFGYEDKVMVMVVSLAHFQDFISLSNTYALIVFGVGLILIMAVIWKLNAMSVKLEAAHLGLEHKNNQLKEIIAALSHEMKTPLALIYAYGAGIRDGIGGVESTEVILGQVDRLSALMDQMLSLSRYEQDIYHMTSFCLSDAVRQWMNNFEPKLKQEGILIDAKIEDDLWISADIEKIQVVVNNLLTNAIKYNTDQHIEMTLKSVGNHAQFKLKNGCNFRIAPSVELVEKLWEPFMVGEDSRDSTLSGTGLGLSIVKVILDKHQFEYGIDIKEGQFVAGFSCRRE